MLNKIDATKRPPDDLAYDRDRYAAAFPISALRGAGVKVLLEETIARLSEGPPYYDDDVLSDRDERFHVAEIVREKVFLRMSEEIPYSAAVQVEEFTERAQGKTFIRAVIYVERETQKGMIIGKNGRALRSIGKEARPEIEELIGKPVYLELWVKVRKNWTKHENDLRQLGYLK